MHQRYTFVLLFLLSLFYLDLHAMKLRVLSQPSRDAYGPQFVEPTENIVPLSLTTYNKKRACP